MFAEILLAIGLIASAFAGAIEVARYERKGRNAWMKVAMPPIRGAATAYRGDGVLPAGFHRGVPKRLFALAAGWLFVGQMFWIWFFATVGVAALGLVLGLSGELSSLVTGAFTVLAITAITSPLLAFGWLARRAGKSLLLRATSARSDVHLAATVAWAVALLVMMACALVVVLPESDDDTRTAAACTAVYAFGWIALAGVSAIVVRRSSSPTNANGAT